MLSMTIEKCSLHQFLNDLSQQLPDQDYLVYWTEPKESEKIYDNYKTSTQKI